MTKTDSLQWGARYGALLAVCALVEIIALLATTFVLPARAQLASDSWPMFHHDTRHTGLSEFDTSATVSMLKWKFSSTGFPPSNVSSSPAVGADGTIYIGFTSFSRTTGTESSLYAINLDGTLDWTYYMGEWGEYSSPAVAADGTIYIGSGGFFLYAINPNGSLKWMLGNGVAAAVAQTRQQ